MTVAGQSAHRQRILLASAALAALYVLVVLPLVESLYFHTSGLTNDQQRVQALFHVWFFVAATGVVYFILQFIGRLRARDRFYIRWSLVAAGYLLVLGVLFVLIYPGQWVWDEIFLLHDTANFTLNSWQHIFTQFYYVFCLYLFPTGIIVVVVQMVVLSLIVGFVVACFHDALVKRKNLAYLLLIPVAGIPVLLNALYPLRLTLYSFLLLLVVARILLLSATAPPIVSPTFEFLFLTVIISVLGVWRTEGALLLVLIPVAAALLGLFRIRRGQITKTVATGLVAAAVAGSAFAVTRATQDFEYSLSAYINPLSVMLNEPLQGAHLEENLAALDQVLDLDKVRAEPNYTDIFNLRDKVRPDSEAHMGEFLRAYVQIVIDNPGVFLEARTKTFLAANNLDAFAPWVGGGVAFFSEDPVQSAGFALFHEDNKLSEAWNSALKEGVTRFLLGVDDAAHPTPFAIVVWSLFPALGLLLLSLVAFLVLRRWVWALIALLELGRFAVIFLTAPSMFNMYYLPTHVVALTLPVSFLALRLSSTLSWRPPQGVGQHAEEYVQSQPSSPSSPEKAHADA